ncbi:MAG: hypothetical protein JWM95_2786 [Gemmatimonadetes bacterium]|nr:hypothetical protein [Gemmatimonadota bacterium]
MEMHSGMTLEPTLDFECLVARVMIENDLNAQPFSTIASTPVMKCRR